MDNLVAACRKCNSDKANNEKGTKMYLRKQDAHQVELVMEKIAEARDGLLKVPVAGSGGYEDRKRQNIENRVQQLREKMRAVYSELSDLMDPELD